MGVTGLWKLIESSGKPVPLETLENKVLAIDISIWLHQVVKGFQDSKGGTLPNAHLLGLFHRLCKLLYYRIKPVFVFDGGVPSLKLETISKRSQTKNKYQSEAERLEHLILTSLAKEKVVQQALGGTTKSLLSPLKGKARPSEKSEDDIFKLPAITNEVLENLDKSITDSTDLDSSTSLDDSNSSLSRYAYNINLNHIDVTSAHFKNLPPDIRYEILSDIKETRKQSSWGRLHELPAESNDFSSFQMKRLLKRRKVQQSIEETEKEMGGKCLSLGELESLLTEDGIVAAASSSATKQIASDENTRFLLVKDMKKAIEKATEEAKKKEDEIKAGPSNIKNEIKGELNENGVDNEFDYDLQLAIQLSMTDNTDLLEPHEFDDNGDIKLSDKQKLNLRGAAMKLARGYMMDYGGMSNEEVNALFETQNEDELNATISEIFKHNDKSIIKGNDIKTILKLEEQAKKSPVYVSSDTDSDFVDVPEDDFDDDSNKFPVLPIQLHIPKNGDISKDFQISDLNTPVEIIINPTLVKHEDDLFADVFKKKSEEKDCKGLFANKTEKENIDVTNNIDEMKVTESNKNSEVSINNISIPINKDSVSDILEKLKQEKENIKNINLDTIQIDDDGDDEHDCNDILETLKKQREDEKTNNCLERIVINQSGLRTPVLLNEDNDEKSNSEVKSLTTIPPKTPVKHSDIIEIMDDDSTVEVVKKTIESYYSPSGKGKTPTKIIDDQLEDADIKITKPFFVNRTPKNKTPNSKSPGSSHKNGELHKSAVKRKVSKSLFQNDGVEEPKKIKPLNTEDLLREASSALKETKSKEELVSMANDLRKEKRELEVERNKQDRFGISISEKMNRDCMQLLSLFGIPYVVAPMEAEAQCAFLNQCKLTDGTITDDSDIWLFGGNTVYKNFFNQKKHVMEFRVEEIEKLYKVDRKKMIQLALLVGSDYTFGINGVGAVTALEILASFPSTPMKEGETTEQMSMLSGLRKFREWWMNGRPVGPGKTALRGKLKNIDLTEGFPSYQVMEAYLYPKIDDSREPFKWGIPDPTVIRDYARKNFGWTSIKTDEILLPVIKKLNEKKSQQSICNYFSVQNALINRDLKLSKRVQGAINKLSGAAESNDETPKNQKRNKKLKKIIEKKKSNDIIEIDDDNKEDHLSNKNIPSTSKVKTKVNKKVNKKQ